MEDWGTVFTPEALKKRISSLEALVKGERLNYRYWKQQLCPYYSDIWEIIEAAIRAKGRYYAGEITRSRLDYRDYLLGRDAERRSTHPQIVIDRMNNDIQELEELLRDSAETYDRFKKKEGVAKEAYELAYKLGEDIIKTHVGLIKNDAETLERYIYG